jgi:hypothetical protein
MDDDNGLTPRYKQQFTAAMALAANKVEKSDKEETGKESFHRINSAKVIKENKRIKSAAKKLVKNKRLKKLSTYFPKK